MALTFVTLPAGGTVQLDDGSHTNVYIQNAGQAHLVVEPNGYTLRAGQTGTFAVTYNVPLTVSSNFQTTVGYQVGAVASAPAGSGSATPSGSSSGLTAAVVKAGVYAPQGWGAAWFAGRNAAASALCEVVWPGDSTTAGDTSSGNVSPITKLMRAKATAAGYADGGRGAAPRGVTDAAADSLEALPLMQSRSGFATSGDVYGVYGALVPRSTTALDTITFQGVGTRCRLLWSRFNNGGRWSYSVNGGTRVNIDPVAPTGIWQPSWIEITGLPGSGATNTVQVRNEGGRVLSPPNATPSITAVAGGTLTAGTYFYKVVAVGLGSVESAPSPVSPGATVDGSSTATVNVVINNTTTAGTQTTGNNRTLALYRSTTSGGVFSFVKTITAAAGAQSTLVDDGAATLDTNRHPAASTPDGTDGGAANDVKVTAEFYNDTGVVWHNAGISGAQASVYFDVADTAFNPAAQALFGLGPSATNIDQLAPSGTAGRRAPKLVVLNFGINDLGSSSADTDALTLADRLSLGIRAARNAGADVLVLVPPLDAVNASATPPRARQGAYRQAIWQTGVSHGCAVVDLNVALGPTTSWSATYGIVPTNPHPTAAGYVAEANFIWNNLLGL